MSPEELFSAAVRCYLRAGLGDHASPCLDALGLWLESARHHENGGRWLDAAERYGRGGDHDGAARCFARAGRWEDAVRHLIEAERWSEAAWICAHHLQRAVQARELGRAIVERAGEPWGTVEAGLVAARAALAAGDGEQAAVLLSSALSQKTGSSRPDVVERARGWATQIAELLSRPDLILRAHASWQPDDGAVERAVSGWAWSGLRLDGGPSDKRAAGDALANFTNDGGDVGQ